MEIIEYIIFLVIHLLAIAGIVIGIFALNKKDKVLNPAPIDSDSDSIELQKWLKTDDGIDTINKVLNANDMIKDFQNTFVKLKIKYKITMTQADPDHPGNRTFSIQQAIAKQCAIPPAIPPPTPTCT